MKTILEGKDVNCAMLKTGLTVTAKDDSKDGCSGYDTPNCGSYCNCLCNGDR